MSKKEKIVIRRDDDLVEIDDELEHAMQALDGANQRIVDLLSTMEPLKALAEPEGTEGEVAEAAPEGSSEPAKEAADSR